MIALVIIILCGLAGIGYAVWATQSVMAADAGSARMQEISAAVREGAQAYLRRQYTTIGIVGIVIFLIVGLTLGWLVGIGFAIGAVLSGLAGFIGMNVSVRANVRTAQAAISSLAGGLEIAFKAGAITGLLVASLALLGVTLYFGFLTGTMHLAPNDRIVIDSMVALGFGASLISIFARLGGGIFTKGADVGGDLVGKVEAGIPEDDPRNPATIADNVGDNVGDCAGMAADLFETYAVTTVATMVLAAIFFNGTPVLGPMMTLPLAIGGICILTSVAGTFFVKLPANQSIMGALYRGLIVTGALSLVGIAIVIALLIGFGSLPGVTYTGLRLFVCGIVGLAVTGLIIWITEYYTGTEFRPVKSIAAASVTGHGTNVIQGLAISHGSDGAAGDRHHRRHSRDLFARRPVRHRHRGHHHAGARRHGRRPRRLRPGHRQCRRHRRDGGAAQGGAQVDRRARRGRQHHQGGHQGLCHRLRRPRRAGAVRGLQRRPQVLHQRPRDASLLQRGEARFRADQSVRRGGPPVRRPAAVSVRRDGDDRGRPCGERDRRGGAAPVQGEARHHAGHRQAGLRPRRRHAHPRRDQGDDHPVTAAGALADLRLLRDLR